MAPEVILCRGHDAAQQGQGFDAFAADVWSLGISLFAMLFGFFPFECSDIQKDWRAWKACEAELKGNSIIEAIVSFYPNKELSISSSARELLDAMLSFDPTCRPSIEQALAYPWVAPYVVRLYGASARTDSQGLHPTGEEAELDGDELSALCDGSSDDDEDVTTAGSATAAP